MALQVSAGIAVRCHWGLKPDCSGSPGYLPHLARLSSGSSANVVLQSTYTWPLHVAWPSHSMATGFPGGASQESFPREPDRRRKTSYGLILEVLERHFSHIQLVKQAQALPRFKARGIAVHLLIGSSGGEASSRCRRAYNRETVQQPSLENSLSHPPTYSSQVKKLVLIGEGNEHCPRSQTGLGLTCRPPTPGPASYHTGKSAGLSQLALSISVCFRGGCKDEMRSPASLSTLFIHSFNNYLLRVYLYQVTEESNMARGPRVRWKTHICSDGYKTLFSTVDLR